MPYPPPPDYRKIDERKLRGWRAVAWLSEHDADAHWDAFLREVPSGQYQQSTMWARAKSVEGWAPLRVVITLDGAIAGGFQLLRRSSWWGGIGYVSKGPVVILDHPGLAEYAKELLLRTVRDAQLRAIVVQPPDSDCGMAAQLLSREFMPNVLTGVNDSTWVIHLVDGFGSVERGMSKRTREQVRQAKRSGLTFREGGRADLGAFFKLMLSTCSRQEVEPNPRDVRFLYQLWDAALPVGSIRLFIAEFDQKPVSGLLCILFGSTVSAWKKGWSGAERLRHPNEFLMHETLKWACQEGYECLDVTAFDKTIALALLKGESVSVQGQRTRHFFHTRFGGTAQLLNSAMIHIPNRALRLLYQVIFYTKIRRVNEESRIVAQLKSSLLEPH